MKSLKKVLATFLLSSALLIGGVIPTTAFAYSSNVERKLEKIEKNIAKENERLSKQKAKTRNSTSGSDGPRADKIKNRIVDLQDNAAKLKKKEDEKIAKAVKSVDVRKKQSSNRIIQLEKDKTVKRTAAKLKYDNDVRNRKLADPTYVAPGFIFTSDSVDKQIAAEKLKIRGFDENISKIKGSKTKKGTKNNK